MSNYDYDKAAPTPDGFNLKLTALELKSLVEKLDAEHFDGCLDETLQQVRADLHSFLSEFYLARSQPKTVSKNPDDLPF